MGVNRPWIWRLTVPKPIKMRLIGPWHDQFQDDCQNWLCCFCMEPPPAVYKNSCPLVVSGWEGSQPSDRSAPPHLLLRLPFAGIQNKANFPLHQPCTFTDFWVACSQTTPTTHTFGSSITKSLISVASWIYPRGLHSFLSIKCNKIIICSTEVL